MQITDFENAAFSVFIVLLSRAILSFGLTFYIPISKVMLSPTDYKGKKNNLAESQSGC